MRRLSGIMLLALGTLSAAAQTLEEDFANPPLSARVSTYWMWMNGNISREGVTTRPTTRCMPQVSWAECV